MYHSFASFATGDESRAKIVIAFAVAAIGLSVAIYGKIFVFTLVIAVRAKKVIGFKLIVQNTKTNNDSIVFAKNIASLLILIRKSYIICTALITFDMKLRFTINALLAESNKNI